MWQQLIPILVSFVSKALGNSIQSSQVRGDFAYTHGMTNIPAQVQEMKDAGLNPALAYGQISAPQGQALGNYQSDILEGVRDLMSSKQAKAESEHRDAETALLRAQSQYLISKARSEARMALFDANHQQDRYNLEIEGKGLINAGQDLRNQGYQIENHGKTIQNEILTLQRDIEEFNKEMKRIDVSKHEDYVKAEIGRMVSSSMLAIKEAWALGQKVPVELRSIEACINKVKAEVREMRLNGMVDRRKIRASAEYQELENAYVRWLSKDPRVRAMLEQNVPGFDILKWIIDGSY